mgnify:CR=1 FL=1
MKKDMDDVTEKLNVRKDEISSSDEQGNRNVEIIDISMEVKRWYSFANLVYALLVGYVWVRHIIGNPTSGNILKLIGSIFVLMVLCIPYASFQSGSYGWLRLLHCLRWRLLVLRDDARQLFSYSIIPAY